MKRYAVYLPVLLAACMARPNTGAIATGSWSWTRGDAGGWLRTEQTDDRVRFQLELSRGAPSYNSGFIEGEFQLRDTRGTFHSSKLADCILHFAFEKKRVVVTEQSDTMDCGFGYGVSAEGTYTRKSRKPPAFSAGDPREDRRSIPPAREQGAAARGHEF